MISECVAFCCCCFMMMGRWVMCNSDLFYRGRAALSQPTHWTWTGCTRPVVFVTWCLSRGKHTGRAALLQRGVYVYRGLW